MSLWAMGGFFGEVNLCKNTQNIYGNKFDGDCALLFIYLMYNIRLHNICAYLILLKFRYNLLIDANPFELEL